MWFDNAPGKEKIKYMSGDALSLGTIEVDALKKAMLYLKFECEEISSLIFSGGDLISSALDNLLINSD